jgi:hypothetical protein
MFDLEIKQLTGGIIECEITVRGLHWLWLRGFCT